MAQTPQTVQYSRLSREQTQEALTVLGIQIATHALTCGTCYRAQQAKKARATSWALLRDALAYEHRIYYLGRVAARKARRTAQEVEATL